jgi:hypothetical protein
MQTLLQYFKITPHILSPNDTKLSDVKLLSHNDPHDHHFCSYSVNILFCASMNPYPPEGSRHGGSSMSEKIRTFECGCVVEWSDNILRFTACNNHTTLVEPAVELCINRIDE